MPFLISPFSKLYFPVVAQRMSKDKKKAQAFTYESQNEIKLLPTASLLVQSSVCHDWIFDSAGTGKASRLEWNAIWNEIWFWDDFAPWHSSGILLFLVTVKISAGLQPQEVLA